MAVSENQPVHRNANAGGHVTEHLGRFEQGALVDIERGKLLGVLCQFGESVSGIGAETVKVLENLVCAVNVLEHVPQGHALHLELAGNINHRLEEPANTDNGECRARKHGERAEDGGHVRIGGGCLFRRAGMPLLKNTGALHLGCNLLLFEGGLGNLLGGLFLCLTDLFSIDELGGRFIVQALFQVKNIRELCVEFLRQLQVIVYTLFELIVFEDNFKIQRFNRSGHSVDFYLKTSFIVTGAVPAIRAALLSAARRLASICRAIAGSFGLILGGF